MKPLITFISFVLFGLGISAQPLIHAHNDYQKPEPLTNALRNKAFSIEADIYLSGNRLLVAHNLPAFRQETSKHSEVLGYIFKT